MGYTFRIPYICRTSVSPGQSAGRVISSRKNYDAGLRPFQLLRLCLSTTNFNLSAAIPFLSTTNSILSTTFPFLSAANRFLSARRQVSTSLPARTRIAPRPFLLLDQQRIFFYQKRPPAVSGGLSCDIQIRVSFLWGSSISFLMTSFKSSQLLSSHRGTSERYAARQIRCADTGAVKKTKKMPKMSLMLK